MKTDSKNERPKLRPSKPAPKQVRMKCLFFALSLGAILFAGCAPQHYIVLLSNGRHVVAAQKPHLEGFNFVFLDLKGRTNSVPSEYVRAIAPESAASTNTPSR
jgi:hypothetical protein